MRFAFRLPLLLITLVAHAAPDATAPAWRAPVGWAQTRGGAEGKVLRVTSLASEGPGTLAAALAAEGPRVVEFTVSGVIDLAAKTWPVTQPFLTLAGETAPSPGITLTNGGLLITTHDVIVRHIRIRPGAGQRAKKSGWEIDGLCTGGGAHDVIVDHCSFTWATDENLSASGPRFNGATPNDWRQNTSHRITFSHCIVGECLHDSAHKKGPHSCGTLIHDNASDIAIVGNLYISNNYRNPLFKGGARGAVINNVVHNPGRSAVTFVLEPPEWEGHPWERGMLVVAGNVVSRGPSTSREFSIVEAMGPCDLYVADNLFFNAAGQPLAPKPSLGPATAQKRGAHPSLEAQLVDAPPLWPPGLKLRPARETRAWVFQNVGARPWDRDAIDRRLVAEAKAFAGRIIDYESEVDGLAAGARP